MNDNLQHQRSLSKMTQSQSIRSQAKEMLQQARELDHLHLLRGPILIGIALLSVTISILQSLSLHAILQFTLLGLGMALLSYDAARMGHDQLRATLRQHLDSMVWDDVLYQFWHPEVDWWRVLVDNFLGQASWMYILPSTSRQRVDLVQAGLGVDEREAERILFAPGGYKNLLLPRGFVQWLNEEDDNSLQERVPKRIAVQEEEVPATSSSSASDTHSDSESAVLVVDQEDALLETNAPTGDNQRKPQTTTSPPPPPSLSDTMKSIVQDSISDQLRQFLLYVVPDSKHLAGVGVAATAALALQLRYSPRARRIAVNWLETGTMASLSTVSVGAASLWLAKLFGTGGSLSSVITESNMVAYISNVLILRKSLSGMATSATTSASNKKGSVYAKGILCAACALALLALRRRQQQQQLRQPPRATSR